jgi:hypothetical protein
MVARLTEGGLTIRLYRYSRKERQQEQIVYRVGQLKLLYPVQLRSRLESASTVRKQSLVVMHSQLEHPQASHPCRPGPRDVRSLAISTVVQVVSLHSSSPWLSKNMAPNSMLMPFRPNIAFQFLLDPDGRITMHARSMVPLIHPLRLLGFLIIRPWNHYTRSGNYYTRPEPIMIYKITCLNNHAGVYHYHSFHSCRHRRQCCSNGIRCRMPITVGIILSCIFTESSFHNALNRYILLPPPHGFERDSSRDSCHYSFIYTNHGVCLDISSAQVQTRTAWSTWWCVIHSIGITLTFDRPIMTRETPQMAIYCQFGTGEISRLLLGLLRASQFQVMKNPVCQSQQ